MTVPHDDPACVSLEWFDDSASGFAVPVELEGHTYRFQFDTGADATILYGTELARNRGWKLETRGARSEVRLSGSVGARRFSDARLVVLPDMPGGELAGTLGMDLLVDRVTLIDFARQRVCIYDTPPADLERRATFVPATLDHDRLFPEVALAGQIYRRILFDTGSSQFALWGSFESWKRWTGLKGELGATQRVEGKAWGRPMTMLGAPAIGALTIGPLSVERPMAFFRKETPDPFGDWPMPTEGVLGNAPFLRAAIVLDGRRAKPRFGVIASR